MTEHLKTSDIAFSMIQKGNKKKLHEVEVKGIELWSKIFARDRSYGGYLGFLCGSQGSGKTSMSLNMADKILREFPNELVLWGEPFGIPAQFQKLKGDFQILSSVDNKLGLYLMKEGEPLHKTDDIPIKTFKYPSEVIRLCKPGILNVIYFSSEHLSKHWLSVFKHFKMDGSWESVFLDESEDIFPFRSRGKQWYTNETFAEVCKELRKCRINMFFNSQQAFDIDFRLLGKINLLFYFRGARVTKISPVWQGAVSGLKQGQCYVVLDHADFGIVRFPKYEPNKTEYILISNRGGKS